MTIAYQCQKIRYVNSKLNANNTTLLLPNHINRLIVSCTKYQCYLLIFITISSLFLFLYHSDIESPSCFLQRYKSKISFTFSSFTYFFIFFYFLLQVKNAMSFAMKSFKRKGKEHSSEQEEQFLLEKVWERLCGRGEGEGNDLVIDEKKVDCLERVRVESLCDRRKENDKNDERDDSDGDESGGVDAVAVKLPQRPRVVPTLPSSHHLSHPTPPLPQPLSSSQPIPLPLPLSSRNQSLAQKNEKESRITSSAKLLAGVSKDTGAVRCTSSSNGSPATTDTVSGSISGTVTGTGSVTGIGTGTRQSTRLALVDAAAAIARRRAATVTVHVDKEYSQTPSSSQHHIQLSHQQQEHQQEQQQQQQRPLRQPLRTLPLHQEQSTTPHSHAEFKIQSPDKQDPKSVLEKRIGAMR
jgi:hypothetical protein